MDIIRPVSSFLPCIRISLQLARIARLLPMQGSAEQGYEPNPRPQRLLQSPQPQPVRSLMYCSHAVRQSHSKLQPRGQTRTCHLLTHCPPPRQRQLQPPHPTCQTWTWTPPSWATAQCSIRCSSTRHCSRHTCLGCWEAPTPPTLPQTPPTGSLASPPLPTSHQSTTYLTLQAQTHFLLASNSQQQITQQAQSPNLSLAAWLSGSV